MISRQNRAARPPPRCFSCGRTNDSQLYSNHTKMKSRINTKWPGDEACFDFSDLPAPLHTAEGIGPVPMVLDDRIGPEVALLLFDRTDFIFRLAAVEPFNLMMKSGVVQTNFGPLMFLLFWVPNPDAPDESITAIDCHINPLDFASVQPWRDLARQSHWHLFLVDADQTQRGFFEFENVYGLDDALERAVDVCAGMVCVDFDLAKKEFCELYDIPSLLRS